MRISDWSSDVCSSDLCTPYCPPPGVGPRLAPRRRRTQRDFGATSLVAVQSALTGIVVVFERPAIGAASATSDAATALGRPIFGDRSEERREGKECVRKCRSGWSP